MIRNFETKKCAFFVQKKARFCSFISTINSNFCAEHALIDDSNRIKCPLDPKHTVFKSKLAKHLKVCNSRIKENRERFIAANYNSNLDFEYEEFQQKQRVESEIKFFNSFTRYIDYIHKNLNQFTFLVTPIQILSDIDNLVPKNTAQLSSFANFIKNYFDVIGNFSLIELGAGKAKLSFFLYKYFEKRIDNVLLIDRENRRKKEDHKIKVPVKRVLEDITNINFANLLENFESDCYLFVAKHLCGNGTCIALKAIVNFAKKMKVGKSIKLVITVCCHQLCKWNDYVYRKIILNFLTANPSHMFDEITRMSSWALSKLPSDNPEIGRFCKNLIDTGRLCFLRNNGFSSSLVNLTGDNVTPENTTIVATFTKIQ